ncbi:MAG TPA: sigma-70 family RNA polymerase sigma factor [Gaiellales bacterium]|nr:sigma-70 family RNA polymerase sigma factor [Gaiellales bacterium]
MDAHQTLSGFETGGQRLAVRLAQQGDIAAREQLLQDFLPLIRQVARHYSSSAVLDREECVQEGVVGLLMALERYDPDLGPPFWPYASWWVRRMMQRLVADLTLPMVLSDRALRQLAHVKHTRQDLEQEYNSEPTGAELLETTGYTQEQLDSLMSVELSPRSLDEPFQGEDGSGGTLGDLLSDPRAEDCYDGVVRAVQADTLRHTPNDLSERERAVLRARFGFDGPPRTLHEVGDDLALSAERVRQIQQQALEKLQRAGSSALSDTVAAYVEAESTPCAVGRSH